MSIEGKKIVVKDLFSDDFFFEVPNYQRPYSWESEQWEELFDDLYNCEREKEYFLGTLILQKKSEIGTGCKYDIIDGQQRITTLQILFASIRDVVNSDDYKKTIQKYIYKEANELEGIPELVKLDIREKTIFKEYIQKLGGTAKTDNVHIENDVQQRILDCSKFFRNKLENIGSVDALKRFAQFIVQKCIMLYLKTEEFDDAFRMFTIINDRGMQLRRIDILKSSNLDPRVIKSKDVREHYSKIWEDMENDLGSVEFENMVSLIRSIIVKERAKEDLLKEYENQIFSKNIIEKGEDFIKYLELYKSIYQSLMYDQDIVHKSEVYMNEFWNHLNLLKKHFPSNEWMSCIMLYYKKFKFEGILEFLKLLENKVVSDWVLALTPTKRSVNVHNILREIDETNDINKLRKSTVFKVDRKQYRSALNGYIYNRRYTKYILLKLELISIEHENLIDFSGTISVEHVLPQTPKANSQWRKDFSDTEIIKWCSKIANLVLLSKKKNSSAGNKDFDHKKNAYLSPKLSNYPRSLEVMKVDKWIPSYLETRQKELVDILMSFA